MTDAAQHTRLGVVVVNYKSVELLRAHLATAEFPDDTRITVVNNSDDDASTLAQLAGQNNWTVISAGTNVGFGKASNLGARQLVAEGCTSILLLNPDAWIPLADLRTLITVQTNNPQAMIAPRVVREDGRLWFSGARLRNRVGLAVHDDAAGSRSDWITAACLLTPANAWGASGGMDEDYFLYWEDVDLTYKWRRTGGTLIVEESAVGFHSVGGTQGGSAGKSATFLYYNCRSRLLFAAKNLDTRTKLTWIVTSPFHMLYMLREAQIHRVGKKGQLLGAVFRGTLAGLRLLLITRSREQRL
jgi:N-acetylglucosaminyl-diphospho-decaprenol L-rhamnosyltransferase